MKLILWFAVCSTGSLIQNDTDYVMFIKQPVPAKSSILKMPVLSEITILEAMEYGFNHSVELMNEGEHSPSSSDNIKRKDTEEINFDVASSIVFDFHPPSDGSLNKSCAGLGIVLATKFLKKKFFAEVDSSLFPQLAEIFAKIPTDSEMCYRLSEKLCGVRYTNETKLECSPQSTYRTYEGSCNNLENPLWGSTSLPFARFLKPSYGDGVNSMRGSDQQSHFSLPSPRKVSTVLQNTQERSELNHFTMMTMQWGQILSHDLALTPESAVKKNGTSVGVKCCDNDNPIPSDSMSMCQPIDTSDDPFFQGHDKACMPFVRSLAANVGCTFGPREQVNQQTSFLDASMIYGSTEAMAMSLRSLEGGKLSITYMGGNAFDYLKKSTKCKKMFNICFKSGDGRVDESAGLTSSHTVLHRAHNIIVDKLSEINPHWDDERLYQEGRRIVGALMQQITFKEYLPLVVGPKIMKKFHLELLDEGHLNVYDSGCNPSIANSFTTAAFRFGHSLIKDKFSSGSCEIPLKGNFFNVSNFLSGKTCPSKILAGLIEDTPGGNDVVFAPVVHQHLFAPNGEPAGLDLMAINIQRGRDHGLPGYMEWRHACQLSTSTKTDFNKLSSMMNEDYAQAFKTLYKNVEDIDLFPAGLAEHPLEDALVGPTFACIIGQQFQNTKFGDRFWYESGDQPKPFSLGQLSALRKVSFSSLLCECSGIYQLQPQAFLSHHLPGNSVKSCNLYEPFDLSQWKE